VAGTTSGDGKNVLSSGNQGLIFRLSAERTGKMRVDRHQSKQAKDEKVNEFDHD
jgi:hypothetical protein